MVKGETYSKNPMVNLSVRSRQGRIGSCASPLPLATFCQMKKRIHRTTDRQSKLKTTEDFHGYSVPPSSSAATNSMEAARTKNAPRKSILRTDAILKDCRILSDFSDRWGKPAGMARMIITSTMTPGGTLPQASISKPRQTTRNGKVSGSLLQQEYPSPGSITADQTTEDWA